MCPSLVLLLLLSLQPVLCVHACSRRTRTLPLFFFSKLRAICCASASLSFVCSSTTTTASAPRWTASPSTSTRPRGTGTAVPSCTPSATSPASAARTPVSVPRPFFLFVFAPYMRPPPAHGAPRCCWCPCVCSTSSARHLVCCFSAIPPVPRVDKSFLPFSRFPWLSCRSYRDTQKIHSSARGLCKIVGLSESLLRTHVRSSIKIL